MSNHSGVVLLQRTIQVRLLTSNAVYVLKHKVTELKLRANSTAGPEPATLLLEFARELARGLTNLLALEEMGFVTNLVFT